MALMLSRVIQTAVLHAFSLRLMPFLLRCRN